MGMVKGQRFWKLPLAFLMWLGHYNLAASRGDQMVGVAQLAERWVVAPEVEGSSPFAHPIVWFSKQLHMDR